MRRSLTFFALLILMGVGAFAQTRGNVRIYVRSVADDPSNASHAGVFRQSFAEEVEGAGYGLAYNAAASDYILNLTVKPNMMLYNDGVERRAPPGEKQSILYFSLVRNQDNAEIVSFSFLYTDPAEVKPYNQYLFYQIMTNLPSFVPDSTPTTPSAEVSRDTSPWGGDARITVNPERVVEIPGPERVVEVPGPERIVEVPGPERIVEVPGPERVVEVPGPERVVEVPGPERVVEVPGPERVVEVIREVPMTVEVEILKEVPVPVTVEVLRNMPTQTEPYREIPPQVDTSRDVPRQPEPYRDVPSQVDTSRDVPRQFQPPRPKEPLKVGPDSWRNKWLYLRASADVPFTVFLVKPGQSSYEKESKIIFLPPGATLGLELQFLNFMSAELDFVARFADRYNITFNPGAALQLKFPLKPASNFMFEPYGAAAFSMNRAASSATPFYLEAGGGVQFGFKGGQAGALFVDVNFMHTFNNILHDHMPSVKEISTKSPQIFFNRFVIGLGVGYKFGFMNRGKY